jgi:hypothetical protein
VGKYPGAAILKNDQQKSNKIDPEYGAAIASLWAALTQTAETDPEAQVFLLMFGPWAGERLRETPKP